MIFNLSVLGKHCGHQGVNILTEYNDKMTIHFEVSVSVRYLCAYTVQRIRTRSFVYNWSEPGSEACFF